MSTDLRRGTTRFVTEAAGARTHHSFSFGPHYDPANVGFGPLTCHDDHVLVPGRGFPTHRHADVEIVTWVVRGGLVHDGSAPVGPGRVTVQSAGTGVTHSELAGASGCRFVQAWLRPDTEGGTPSRHVAPVLPAPGVTPLVGRRGPLRVGVAGAALDVVRLSAGEELDLAPAPLVHVYVVTGSARTAHGIVREGDALRLTAEPALRLRADARAEALVWRFAGG